MYFRLLTGCVLILPFYLGCYSSTVFYFQNLRMKPLPPSVKQGLYKQDEIGCGKKIREVLNAIPEKNPSATHIRDLEIYKKDDGLFSSCYRLNYGLEISQ
ncbi:hypothetical protein EHQ27_15465 [Leptospira wolffii]|nr:hypothetical protein EHQ32_12030 [Leptospira wolffii]TGK67560.1 hypothetical protein EHQ27_15465 [Leptospira wolffii]TGK72679.1 hypothetical protein EHQ35_11100 [Leptospira wolffii]TGL26870.1 hypothetical protein EHQ57_17575 [Leptospira wolffii]